MGKKKQFSLKEVKEFLEVFFTDFYDRIKGRKDIKTRVDVLANPDNPKSMSVLTSGQANFVSTAYFSARNPTWGECFKPMEFHAEEIMDVSPSKGGLGREQSIRFVAAWSEAKLLSKLGLSVGKEEKEAKA